MNIFDGYFPLGLGTTRLPIKHKNDIDGIETAAEIIAKAINLGVDYIDTSYLYARGAAHSALKIAIKQINKPVAVTCKVRYGDDYSSDDARRRIEQSLYDMGLSCTEFACVWTVMDYDEFKCVMKKGGIFEGILKAKEEGLCRHIIFSTHAPQKDIIRIVNDNVFEGVTISLSPLNIGIATPIIDVAKKRGIGVVAMNPLSGGLIPDNADAFKYLIGESDESIAQAALRYVKAAGVDIVLSGCRTLPEVEDNVNAFKSVNKETSNERIERIDIGYKETNKLCTGCGYCVELNACPANINIPAFMQSKNMLEFNAQSGLIKLFNRTDTDLLKSMSVFKFMFEQFSYIPKSKSNPCIACGNCEAVCTQNLDICAGLKEVYERAEKTGFSIDAQNARVERILGGKGYKRIGVYPNTMQAGVFADICERVFGKSYFEWVFFNSDPKMQRLGDNPVYGPHDIPNLNLDMIVIVNYRYDNEIYNAIKPTCDECNVDLAILFDNKDDLPFIFN
jgi:predicted aldo/keto reductase-like oxidoreductase